jgi:quinoprotein glucose dehydrogenase
MRSPYRPPSHRRTSFALTITATVVVTCAPLSAVFLSSGAVASVNRPPGARTDGASSTSAVEWPASGAVDGSHFSPLEELTPSNVSGLRAAWVYRTGDVSDGSGDVAGTSFQATPVMVSGTLYFPTPFGRVIALDAETGEERWTFDPGVDRSSRTQKYMTSRGVAVWVDRTASSGLRCSRRIIVATIDARLLALDAGTGELCRTFGRGGEVNLRHGVRNIRADVEDYRQTSPPTVVGDLVIVGSSIADNGRVETPSGVVRAFDARDGRLRWSWEPLLDVYGGGDTAAWGRIRAGAANAWSTFSVDTARGLVFVPTSSPSPDHYGAFRPGPNRHANSVVALDALTGSPEWAYQLVHHDLWDYDAAAQPALAEVRRDGIVVPLVIAASKVGHLFFLRRDTGEPFFPVEERPVPRSDVPGEQPSPTQPFPTRPLPLAPQQLGPDDAWGVTPVDREWCRRRIAQLRSDGVFTPPSLRGTITFPGFIGGMAWGGVAVDNARGIVITNTNRLAGIVTLVPKASAPTVSSAGVQLTSYGEQDGAPYGVRRELLLSPLRLPCNAPPWGTLVAIDIATGAVRWEIPLGSMSDLTVLADATKWGSISLGGPLITASGVVFIGASMDRRLRAFDTETGKLLWSAALPASAQATPMTYRASPGGRQYVVVAAGGHSAMRSALGDYVMAFALP